MGLVYEAEETGSVRRRVALKVIRAGLDSREIVSRFEAERQALAVMNHPGIAKVLHAGTTEAAQPYFAMELVRGLPITQFCDSHRLAVPERLELFIAVCHAVQHAHQKGVIHRDLKPSNVLVVDQDGRGQPKIIDFGIAKVLNPEDHIPDQIPVTKTGLLPLTPAYASPEQIRGEPVTTASDIYQLGVVLYELLTGFRPYEVSGRTPSEIEQIICEQTPTRPSTAVTHVAEADGDGTRTGGKTDPDLLRKKLKGDLDTIILKALRKEPDRRYESSEQLAADIGLYLSGRPVSAHPDSRMYRRARSLTVSIPARPPPTLSSDTARCGLPSRIRRVKSASTDFGPISTNTRAPSAYIASIMPRKSTGASVRPLDEFPITASASPTRAGTGRGSGWPCSRAGGAAGAAPAWRAGPTCASGAGSSVWTWTAPSPRSWRCPPSP